MSFGKILNITITKLVKDLIKFEDIIDLIKSRFDGGCPKEEDLEKLIEQKNQLLSNLNIISRGLSNINSTSSSIEKLLKSIDILVKVIKTLPLPSAIFGVGVPIGLINRFADSLDNFRIFIIQNKATLKQITLSLKIIKSYLDRIIEKINSLDNLIISCAISYDREDLVEQIENFNIDIPTPIIYDDSILRDRLKINSPNPYIYKNYRLILEEKPGPILIPQIRIIGIELSSNILKEENNIIIRNFYEGDDSWSHTTNLSILVEEIKWMIDINKN